MDVNRLLNQPTFNPDRGTDGVANDKQSSTAMLNGNLQGPNEMSSHTQVIWGTNINTSDVQMKLKTFINNFEEIKDEEESDIDDMNNLKKPSYYLQRILDAREADERYIEVNCDHIFQFDQGLYRQIEDYPADIIPIFDLVVTQVYRELDMYNMGANRDGMDGDQAMNNFEDEGQLDQIIQVRPYNLRKIHRIRELGPQHIDRLISFRGIIIRNSDIVPELKEAAFTCVKCYRQEERIVQNGRIVEPTICPNC